MHFAINVDHDDFINPSPARLKALRAAAYFILNAIGDLDEAPAKDEAQPTPPPPAPFNMTFAESQGFATTVVPPPPPAFTGYDYETKAAPIQGNHASVPPPPVPSANTAPPVSAINETNNPDLEDDGDEGSNVVQGNFPYTAPPPPPPPPMNGAVGSVPPPPASSSPNSANIADTPAPPSNAAGVAGVTGAALDVDKSGMPWDARIHQSGKNLKKDGNWKLKKGVDPSVVQSVTAELAAKRGSLPPNAVPVPPQQNAAPAATVPPPPTAASTSVPVPPPPAVGLVGASTSAYQAFLDRVIAETKAGKITHQRVSQICQEEGAPSISDLAKMQHLLPNVERKFEMVILGLA